MSQTLLLHASCAVLTLSNNLWYATPRLPLPYVPRNSFQLPPTAYDRILQHIIGDPLLLYGVLMVTDGA